MVSTIKVESKVTSISGDGTISLEFPTLELPLVGSGTTLTSLQNLIIDAEDSFTIPVNARIQALTIISSRPIQVTLVKAEDDYILPYQDYIQYVNASEPTRLELIESIQIDVPVGVEPVPVNAPALYPKAVIKVFLAIVNI